MPCTNAPSIWPLASSGLIARPMSHADQAPTTRTLPVASSTSTSTTRASKLKMPICANGRPSATARFGSKVFWSKTQLWVPMIGPPAAQWARPEMSAKLTARLRHALDRDLAAGQQLEIVDRALEHLAGMLLELLLDLGGGADHRATGHVGDAARGRAPVVGRAVGVGAGDGDPVDRHLQRLGADLGRAPCSSPGRCRPRRC